MDENLTDIHRCLVKTYKRIFNQEPEIVDSTDISVHIRYTGSIGNDHIREMFNTDGVIFDIIPIGSALCEVGLYYPHFENESKGTKIE